MKRIILILLAAMAFFANPPVQAFTLEQKMEVYDSIAAEKAGDYNRAISKMVSLLQIHPTDYLIHLRLGWLFYLAKKYKNSSDHYEQASKIAPQSIEPLLGLSLVFSTTGAHEKATHACSLILQRDSKNYLGLQRLIAAEIQLHHFPKALEYLAIATQLYPTDPIFLEQKAFSLKAKGQKTEARAVLSTLLLVSPQNAYARSQVQ